MSIVVPACGSGEKLRKYLNQNFTLRLGSNNVIPDVTDDSSDYTEVAGGGYVAITLTFANWSIIDGNPAVALYNAFQDFNFTGITGGPGTIYTYYVLDAGGILGWSERFSSVPITPQNGTLIRIKPRYTERNQV